MASIRLMPAALSLGICELEDESNVSSVVGDGGSFCGNRYAANDLSSGFLGLPAGAWAASPWMVMIVANVATETPRHMKSLLECLRGATIVLWGETGENLFEA